MRITNGNFSVELGKKHDTIKIKITDINGRLVESSEFSNSQILNLKLAEPSGIYLLTVESAEHIAVIRLVKQ